MFDDLPTRPNSVPPNLPTDGAPVAPTSGTGLPLVKPQTIPSTVSGSGLAMSPKPPSAPTAEPEDILGDVDIPEPSIKGPDQGLAAMPRPAAVALPEKPVAKEPFFKTHKTTLAGAIATLLVIGLALASWYAYGLLTSRSTPAAVVSPNTEPPVQPIPVNEAINNAAVTVPSAIPSQPIDTDRDGLDDAEEALYGTNPGVVDTDQDGLTDRDEVKVFKTDPNNADSDGDTYFDGQEVRGGYDPLGSGRLLQVP